MFEIPICLKTLLTWTDEAVMGTHNESKSPFPRSTTYIHVYILMHIHICMWFFYNCSLQFGKTNQAFGEQNEVVKKEMLTWININIVHWTMTLYSDYLEDN